MFNRVIMYFLVILVVALSSCKDSTIDPNKETGAGSKYIVYTSSKNDGKIPEIRKYNTETSDDIMLVDSAAALSGYNGWIYYFKEDENEKVNLYKCDYTGNNRIMLMPFPSSGAAYSQLSGDCSMIIYYEFQNPGLVIHCSKTDGTGDVIIGSNPDYSYDDPYPWSNFSSDMKKICTVKYNQDDPYDWNLTIQSIDGTILKDGLPVKGFLGMRGSWSPDNRKIAYSKYESSNSSWNMALLDLETGKSSQLTNNGTTLGSNYCWSPDGRKIAFYLDAGEFYLINSDGTNLVQVTNIETNPNNMDHFIPSWSSDSKRIIFQTSVNEEGGDIFFGDLKMLTLSTMELKTIVPEECVWNAFFLE